MLLPIPTKNGEIIDQNKLNPGDDGQIQYQWTDDYFVMTITREDGRASKFIWIGSIASTVNGWDLGNSDAILEARFEYQPSAERTISTGECEAATTYCNTPISTTTQSQPAESGLLYRNPEGTNRPLMDEGRYEHQRSTIFRYSSFGEFKDVVTDLDKDSVHHPLTDDRDVVSKNGLDIFVPEKWWEDPFAIISSTTNNENSNSTQENPTDGIEAIASPSKFKKKTADKITDFNPSTDTLKIDTDSFDIDSSATFAAGKNKKVVKKQLAKLDVDLLYDQKKGGLYFNENGTDKGFGDGGIIAILKGAPELTSGNLEFI